MASHSKFEYNGQFSATLMLPSSSLLLNRKLLSYLACACFVALADAFPSLHFFQIIFSGKNWSAFHSTASSLSVVFLRMAKLSTTRSLLNEIRKPYVNCVLSKTRNLSLARGSVYVLACISPGLLLLLWFRQNAFIIRLLCNLYLHQSKLFYYCNSAACLCLFGLFISPLRWEHSQNHPFSCIDIHVQSASVSLSIPRNAETARNMWEKKKKNYTRCAYTSGINLMI